MAPKFIRLQYTQIKSKHRLHHRTPPLLPQMARRKGPWRPPYRCPANVLAGALCVQGHACGPTPTRAEYVPKHAASAGWVPLDAALLQSAENLMCERGESSMWGSERCFFAFLKTFLYGDAPIQLHERIQQQLLDRFRQRNLDSKGCFGGEKCICVSERATLHALFCVLDPLACDLDGNRDADSCWLLVGRSLAPSAHVWRVWKLGGCDYFWAETGVIQSCVITTSLEVQVRGTHAISYESTRTMPAPKGFNTTMKTVADCPDGFRKRRRTRACCSMFFAVFSWVLHG